MFFPWLRDMISGAAEKRPQPRKGIGMAKVSDIGIDFGTSNIVIFMKGRGIVFREPAVVSVDRESGSIIAMGTEAFRMIGRTPGNIQVIRPVAQGEMVDFDLAATMLQRFVSQVLGHRIITRPRAILSVPAGVKDMEKKALITSLFDAGVRRTQMLDRCIAAALGAQAQFQGSYGCMIVEMSAGCTDMAVLYNGSVTLLSTLQVGGDQFDDAIIRYIRKKYHLLIGERTAEQIKTTLGGASLRSPRVEMDATGRSLISNLPKTITIESDEIFEALTDSVNDLIEGIQVMIERTPPQLASDIFEAGVILTGGAAALYGLAETIEEVLKIPCRLAQDARDCVALGCGRVLMEPNTLRNLLRSRV